MLYPPIARKKFWIVGVSGSLLRGMQFINCKVFTMAQAAAGFEIIEIAIEVMTKVWEVLFDFEIMLLSPWFIKSLSSNSMIAEYSCSFEPSMLYKGCLVIYILAFVPLVIDSNISRTAV